MTAPGSLRDDPAVQQAIRAARPVPCTPEEARLAAPHVAAALARLEKRGEEESPAA